MISCNIFTVLVKITACGQFINTPHGQNLVNQAKPLIVLVQVLQQICAPLQYPDYLEQHPCAAVY